MAAESTVPKGAASGAITLIDGTSTPVTLSLAYSMGDLQGSELSQNLNEVVPVEVMGDFVGLVYGNRRYPSVSFSVSCHNIVGSSSTAPGTPLEFTTGKGAYSSNISTIGVGRPMLVDVKLTIEGTNFGDAADETITFEDCYLIASFTEALEGNKLAFQGTCYGSIVSSNNTNAPSFTDSWPSTSLQPAPEAPPPDWEQITTTQQASNAIFDPSTLTMGSTGLSAGVFTWQVSGLVTVVNGYRENCPGWTRKLTSQWSDFNPDTDVVDMALSNITGLPLNTVDIGLAIGILDTNTAGRASANGNMIWMIDFNASNYTAALMGASAAAATSNEGTGFGTGLQFIVHMWWTKENGAYTQHISGQWYDGTYWNAINVNGYSGLMSSTYSNWEMNWFLVKNSTDSATQTITSKVWARRTVTSGYP